MGRPGGSARILIDVPAAVESYQVPIQGAYLARTCPVAPQLAADSSLNIVEVPRSEVEQARADAGIEFERFVFEAIVDHHQQAVAVINSPDRQSAQAATAAAMASGITIILGGWLPDDLVARRTGRPDVLLKVAKGWIPVDVKHHIIAVPNPRGSEQRSSLDDLWPDAAVTVPGMELSGKALDDSLQLAHYWRLLEAGGLATDVPLGGIIGSDGTAWWIDLAEPRWKRRTVSALELYEKEFQLRLDIIARQIERNADPAVPPLVIPLRKSECLSCGWRQVCGDQLVESDSVSLIPGLRWPNALQLIRAGIASRTELAQLDWQTARLIHGEAPSDTQVDLSEILAAAEGCNPSKELSELLGRRKRARLARLSEMGITRVGDLGHLNERMATLSKVKVGYLPDLIDQARATVAGRVFRARGVDRIAVPQADVEVDVDMENCEFGVYLWGTWTRVETATVGYEPFVDWRPLDEEIEAEVFARFWDWLTQLRRATTQQGGTFVAYCYSPAENTQMRRVARSGIGPSLDEVESFIASSYWVDLHAVVKGQLVTGTGLGLKQIAPLAGFHWRDEDPGGDQSTVWYERAVEHSDWVVREENRLRLLAYNEDDVRATAVLRNWLSSVELQSIDSWTATADSD